MITDLWRSGPNRIDGNRGGELTDDHLLHMVNPATLNKRSCH